MSIPADSWHLAGRAVSPFRACGLTGLAAAAAVALGVTAARGASLALEAGVIVLAVVVFLGLALFTKALTGRETLIYYHHEIAVLGVTSAAVWLIGGPVGPHFDATALGLGAFLACGRIGCLTVGCCHGRPARRGIRYPSGHSIVPRYLTGLPLIPVQALEAAAVAGLVVAGIAAGGGALYVTGYAALRFGLEALRGDPGRRRFRGVTEAQWTSVALALLAAAITGGAAHAAVALALAAAAAILAVRAAPPRRLLDPRHVDELRHVLAAAPPGRAIAVRETSLGVRVTSGRAAGREHYALSGVAGEGASELAPAIAWLRRWPGDGELVAGAAGVWHVLSPP